MFTFARERVAADDVGEAEAELLFRRSLRVDRRGDAMFPQKKPEVQPSDPAADDANLLHITLRRGCRPTRNDRY